MSKSACASRAPFYSFLSLEYNVKYKRRRIGKNCPRLVSGITFWTGDAAKLRYHESHFLFHESLSLLSKWLEKVVFTTKSWRWKCQVFNCPMVCPQTLYFVSSSSRSQVKYQLYKFTFLTQAHIERSCFGHPVSHQHGEQTTCVVVTWASFKPYNKHTVVKSQADFGR